MHLLLTILLAFSTIYYGYEAVHHNLRAIDSDLQYNMCRRWLDEEARHEVKALKALAYCRRRARITLRETWE